MHGATLAGINLPAALVSQRLNRKIPPSASATRAFTRIVIEIPQIVVGARPVGPAAIEHQVSKGHPSGMPALSRSMTIGATTRGCHVMSSEIDLPLPGTTPVRSFLPNVLQSRLAMVRRTLDEVSLATGVSTHYAFSMKTNPNPQVLDAVLGAGGGIECISRAEVSRALSAGFHAESIVLNGPGKWWPHSSSPISVGFTFADSVEDFHRILHNLEHGVLQSNFVGVRVRPPRAVSRFGLNLSDRDDFLSAASIASRVPRSLGLGMHFHKAMSAIGPDAWLENFEGALELFAALCSVESIRPSVVDIGGGWPASLPIDELRRLWQSAVASSVEVLGPEIRVLTEPGKLVVEPAMVLVSRVLEVHRSREGVRAIVVDAAVNHLPDFHAPSRRVLWRPSGSNSWSELAKGNGEVLGRVCMENDRLRRMVDLPSSVTEGDAIAFLGVGAYDESMAYDFAC